MDTVIYYKTSSRALTGCKLFSYYADQCTDIYGADYTRASVQQAVQKTNQFYGGRDNLNSSYIILPNGSFGPWHALGKLSSSSDTIVTVSIIGTAHCANMYPPLDDGRESEEKRETSIFRCSIVERCQDNDLCYHGQVARTVKKKKRLGKRK